MSWSPGVYYGVSNRDYHADPAIGSTSLKTLATRTPAHWLWDSQHRENKAVFDIGTAAHSLILEQDESGLVIVDADSWRTKAAQEARLSAYDDGLTPLLRHEFEEVARFRDAVMAHPDAAAAFTGHIPEVSYFHDDDGLMVKARADAKHPGLIVDLKTLVSADPRDFRKKAFDIGYHQSAAHYIDTIESVTGERCDFIFVNVEKSGPYLVSIIELDESFIELGRQANARAKDIYRRCVASGEWPGYPPMEPLSAPKWAEYKETLDV